MLDNVKNYNNDEQWVRENKDYKSLGLARAQIDERISLPEIKYPPHNKIRTESQKENLLA